jgi:hypothetical protein
MSGIKYEKLTGKDLIAALRGGACGDLLEDAAYAAADEIERLRSQLADARRDIDARIDAALRAAE